jgi:hypothetical protein
MYTFEDYKNRISIIQVAQDLGYILKPKSGKIKPEFVLYANPEQSIKEDEIVICNPLNNASQTYFSRKGEKGNLIHFVYNRIQMFTCSSSGWNAVNEILSKYMDGTIVTHTTPTFTEQQAFNLADYDYRLATLKDLAFLNFKRNISRETLNLFLPFIFITRDKKASYFNTAFPYRIPGKDKIVGFELRNSNYKGFSKGGDKSNAVWHVCFNNDITKITKVFFFESAIDLMSFVQIYRDSLDLNSSVFISTGGNVTRKQIVNVMKFYSNAFPFFCFDNDVQGNIFDLMAAYFILEKECKAFNSKGTITIQIEAEGINLSLPAEGFSSEVFFYEHQLNNNAGIIKSPAPYKDFNAVLQHI